MIKNRIVVREKSTNKNRTFVLFSCLHLYTFKKMSDIIGTVTRTNSKNMTEPEPDEFKLKAPYKPTGDQPQAIAELVKGFKEGNQCQTLLGVTGSGKTFTMANVIQQLQKPTLVIAHNKTLAAQLYGEFKEMFPENAVEYFVS